MANFVNFNANEFKNVVLGTSNWWGRDHDLIVDEYDGIVGRHVIEEWDPCNDRVETFYAYTNNPDAVQALVDEDLALEEEATAPIVWISVGTMLENGACQGGINRYIEEYMTGLHPVEVRNLLKVIYGEETVPGWYSRLYPIPYEDVKHWLCSSTISEWKDGEHKVSLAAFLA